MKHFKRTVLLTCSLLLQACSTLVATPQSNTAPTQAVPSGSALAAWARVLATHVNERGQVDFVGLARAPADLHTYVRYVAQTAASDIADKNDQLAHHINAYNALSMFNVIDMGIPRSNQSLLARYRFFIARKHLVGGQRLSLYAYENDVIRKFNEPRIHWALNCSSVSCPVLPRVPFEGPQLQAQLQAESLKFFAMPSNFRVDQATRTVYLSEIMDFFPEDFVPGHAASLLSYANRYAPSPADPRYAVKFSPYDWTITNWEK